MSPFSALFRLARPFNLAIMAVTMVVLRYCILDALCDTTSIGMHWVVSGFDFVLIMAVVVLLAAAGNIINDYFDQKVDRINRPDKVIIGKEVKRRVAMLLHQSFNVLALGLTLWLSWKYQLWNAVIFTVSIATVLWFYTPILKKRPFIGNLAIAACVAIVPIWFAYFDISTLQTNHQDMLLDTSIFTTMWHWMLSYAFFAFMITLAREIIKDIEDVEGDKAENYRTLPIAYSEVFARNFSVIVLWLTLVLFVAASYITFSSNLFTLLAATICVAIPLLVGIQKTGRSRDKKSYHTASAWLKAAMVGGLLFSYFAGEFIRLQN